jgi:hypothetical protein
LPHDGWSIQTSDLARRQYGVIARWQLLDLGISRRAIEHALAKNRLFPVFRGVYAVGRPELTGYGWWMAAVLACGRDAALSHGSAGGARGGDAGGRVGAAATRARVRDRPPRGPPADAALLRRGLAQALAALLRRRRGLAQALLRGSTATSPKARLRRANAGQRPAAGPEVRVVIEASSNRSELSVVDYYPTATDRA